MMMNVEMVRDRVGTVLSDQEAEVLVAWYANLARGVASFPLDELKGVEPPLRSVAGPPAR
jgi:hypothetical protein